MTNLESFDTFTVQIRDLIPRLVMTSSSSLPRLSTQIILVALLICSSTLYTKNLYLLMPKSAVDGAKFGVAWHFANTTCAAQSAYLALFSSRAKDLNVERIGTQTYRTFVCLDLGGAKSLTPLHCFTSTSRGLKKCSARSPFLFHPSCRTDMGFLSASTQDVSNSIQLPHTIYVAARLFRVYVYSLQSMRIKYLPEVS